MLLVGLMGGTLACDRKGERPYGSDQLRNLTGPDDVRTVIPRGGAGPDEVERMIAMSFAKVWEIGHHWDNANFASNTMSNRHSASWGNMGMADLGREPREPLPNSSSYRWAYVVEGNWNDAYRGLAATSDGIRAIDAGLEIGPGGERNIRARSFALGVRGILSCLLALWYEEAVVVDETIDPHIVPEPVSYGVMAAHALRELAEAEAVARGSSFMLDGSWINGNAWNSKQLADYLVSWQARCAANLPRTDAEAMEANWSQIVADAERGIRDVVVTGEDYSGSTRWWDGLKSLMQEQTTWHRMHMDWIGMADQSGEYQDWLSHPLEQRSPRRLAFGDDARFPPVNEDSVTSDVVSPSVASDGPRSRYNETIIFRAERGTYRQSHYGDMRYDAYQNSCRFCWFGPIEHMTSQEMDHYIAEGRFRLGDFAGAAAIVNETRIEAGLPPAPANATDPVPSNEVGECTPRKRYDVQGRCGNLRDAMWFEHFENVFNVFGGLEFWHGRRNDLLPAGTALHLPMPALELQLLMRYGSSGATDGRISPDGGGLLGYPGDLRSALQRAAVSLANLEASRTGRAHGKGAFIIR